MLHPLSTSQSTLARLISHFGMILGRAFNLSREDLIDIQRQAISSAAWLLMYRRPTLPGWISPDLTFETLVCRISLQCFGLYFTLWNGRVSLPCFTRNSEDGCYNLLISRFEMHMESGFVMVYTLSSVFIYPISRISMVFLMLLVQRDVVWLLGAGGAVQVPQARARLNRK